MLSLLLIAIVLIFIASIFTQKRKTDQLFIEKAKIDKTRKCPHCSERIIIDAKLCRFCRSDLEAITNEELNESEEFYKRKISTYSDKADYSVSKEKKKKNSIDWKNH